MKYYDIKNQLQALRVFTLQDIYLVDPEFRQPTLYEWVKKGLVIQLRQNRYMFSDDTPMDKELYFIANKIIKPSYVSLEMALYHYGVIPELVQSITSVTTRKTNEFVTPYGTFSYQSILPELYVGYQIISYQTYGIQLAYVEKAILDYLYFHHEIRDVVDFEELRWNKEMLRENINLDRLASYLNIFDNQALVGRVGILKKYLDQIND